MKAVALIAGSVSLLVLVCLVIVLVWPRQDAVPDVAQAVQQQEQPPAAVPIAAPVAAPTPRPADDPDAEDFARRAKEFVRELRAYQRLLDAEISPKEARQGFEPVTRALSLIPKAKSREADYDRIQRAFNLVRKSVDRVEIILDARLQGRRSFLDGEISAREERAQWAKMREEASQALDMLSGL